MKVQNKIDKFIFGVILAAGYSSRFGSEKLIVKIKGKSIIKHVAEKVNNSNLNDFVIIAGKNYPVIKNKPQINSNNQLSPELKREILLKEFGTLSELETLSLFLLVKLKISCAGKCRHLCIS